MSPPTNPVHFIEQARGLSDSVEWRVGAAYTLDADLHDFDVVHAHQVLQHLADRTETDRPRASRATCDVGRPHLNLRGLSQLGLFARRRA